MSVVWWWTITLMVVDHNVKVETGIKGETKLVMQVGLTMWKMCKYCHLHASVWLFYEFGLTFFLQDFPYLKFQLFGSLFTNEKLEKVKLAYDVMILFPHIPMKSKCLI